MNKEPKVNRRLSGVDAAFLYLERREIPLAIAGVFLFEGPIPFEDFVKALDSKLHLIPRYRQIATPPEVGVIAAGGGNTCGCLLLVRE